ncbi:hypothetical protein FRC07_011091 [Ceratobasidium sp. 392]|nr:hypothetical protein FRC07_011091 [Ceratobasidium sp. 392]
MSDNLFCANLIDRLFNEHPDWYPGKPKRVEWNKRKQAWDREVTIANTRPRRSTAAYARVPVTPQPQRLLFNPDSDDEDDDFFRGDENFRQEFLHELALQGRAFRFQIYD